MSELRIRHDAPGLSNDEIVVNMKASCGLGRAAHTGEMAYAWLPSHTDATEGIVADHEKTDCKSYMSEALVDARTTSPDAPGELMVRLRQNPAPHGVLEDGTELNPFVWCGRD